jgi:phosphoribosylcarboxyaminoimidazole (NCAIR) mutase
MLAARTSWPVIAVSMTAKERPHDVWSSLETPSQVPLLTALSVKNAILAALNMLAQKNPIAYMHRQYAIEQLVEPHR